jgi:hypothetical protein
VLLPKDVRAVKKHTHFIDTLAFMNDVGCLEMFIKAGVDIIRLWESWVTKEIIDHIHASGKKVWIMAGSPEDSSIGYTKPENMRAWSDMGADGVLINDVNWARIALGLMP